MATKNSELGAHLVEEEESYFVSMTDMMVGIIFIFVILLMTFALSYREAEEVRQDKVEQLEAADRAKRDILESIKQSLEEVGIRVEIDLENGILHLPEEILFPSGSARLNSRGRESLGHLARALAVVVPCYSAAGPLKASANCPATIGAKLDAIFVEGHTDDVPVGSQSSFEDNWDLSAQRAIETYKQLIQIEPRLDNLEVDRTDVEVADGISIQPQKLFSVSGYGQFRPREDNLFDEGKQANRRIDLRFLMKTPRSEDLEVAEQQIAEEAKPSEP